MTTEQQIARVERSARQLLSQVEHLSTDVLYRKPGPGEWPVMSTLAHVAEFMPYWAHQAEHVAKSPGSRFGRSHDDPVRIGAVEEHGHDALNAVVERIRAALDECVETLRKLPEDAWETIGQHPRRGQMSVGELVTAFIANHVEEHAAQVQATLTALQAPQRSGR